MESPQKEKKNKSNEKKNFFEWIVFTISLLLVVSILAYLTYKTITHQSSPPEIEVIFRSDPSVSAPYRYYVEVKNTGGTTAEEVSVELLLEKDDEIIERSELQIAFVPQKSKREGWMNFSKNPEKADTIFARVISFKKP